MSIGDRIRDLREKRQWSQLFLSEKLGIHNSVLSRIEAGKRPVEDELLAKISDVFDVSVDFLLGRTNDPTPPSRSNDLYIAYRHGKKSIEVETDEEAEYLKEELEKFRAWKAAKARERQRDK